METIICSTGGESRGNPGAAAIAVFVSDKDDKMIEEVAQGIGNANSNFAAYYAVMLGLQTLESRYSEQTKTIQFELRLDNEFVANQLNSKEPVTEPGLVPMFIEIHNIRVKSFPNLVLTLIPKTINTDVSRLLVEVLDDKQ